MNLLYDHQIFSTQTYGGISRYFAELIKNYNKDENVNAGLSLKYSNNYYINDLSYRSFFPNHSFRGKERILLQINKANTLKALRSRNYDIFHPTYYDPYFLKYLDKTPFVITVYDMIHEIYRDRFTNFDVSTINKKREVIEKASAVIAISENTKKDIIKIYGIDADKIKVVYLGNSINNLKSLHKMKLPKRFILYIGDRHVYKNFQFFLKSIIPLLKSDKDLHLICGGSSSFNEEETKIINNSNCEERILHSKIENDRTLVNLYSGSLAFIFPTLYEGFGIPILESLACGTPAILSNTSSLPEIGGNAAVYFDPDNSDSIVETVKKVIYDKSLSSEMIKNGHKQVNKFSWSKCALETKKVYESVLE